MKVLPIDIRQKAFPKKTFGGFDPNEVQSFLTNLSEEWLTVTNRNKELEGRLSDAQLELDRLHQMENALLDALNKAELRKKEIIEQSKKEARMRVMEGEIAAEALMSTAKQRAEQMINNVRLECETQLRSMQQDFDVLNESYQEVEAHTSKLIEEMQHFVEDANLKIAHLSNLKQKRLITDKINTAKELLDTASNLTRQIDNIGKTKVEVATESVMKEVENPLAKQHQEFVELENEVEDYNEEPVKQQPTNHQRTTLQMLQEKAKASKSTGSNKLRKVV